MQRIPPSTQKREALTAQFQAGRAGHPLRQFVARAAELMLQVGLEEQVAAFFGRGHYARGPAAQPGWRNGYGAHTLKTEAGPLTLRPPKVRATTAAFRVQLPAGLAQTTPELRTLVTRAYVRGLSDRDVEGLYAEVFGGSFSKSAVSRATAKLTAEFDTWRTRDLSALKVVYLFSGWPVPCGAQRDPGEGRHPRRLRPPGGRAGGAAAPGSRPPREYGCLGGLPA